MPSPPAAPLLGAKWRRLLLVYSTVRKVLTVCPYKHMDDAMKFLKKSHNVLTIAVWNNRSNNCHVPWEFTRDY